VVTTRVRPRARAVGAKNRRIIVREVLPNVMPAMFSIALLGVAVVIVAEGGLAILGVGAKLPDPSWGNIIAEGYPGFVSRSGRFFAPIDRQSFSRSCP